MTLRVTDNVFTELLFLKIQNFFYNILNNDNFHYTNINVWEPDIKGDSKPVKVYSIDKQSELFLQIYHELKNKSY